MYCYNCMNEINEGSEYCVHCGNKTAADDIPHHLKSGTVLNNKYLVGNAIGEGGFGITYIGRDLTLDIKIAIKEFYPSGYANRNNTLSNKVTLNYRNEGEYFKNGRDNFLEEAKRIAKFSNERGIVDVRDFFEENDTAYIIMEYLDGLNLSEKVKRDGNFEPAVIFNLLLPIMYSLDKMHKANIVHRDISPENIRILTDGSLKLMDFGSARYYAGMEKKTMSVQFKPGFAPFEQYNKNGNQGPWTDVYGLCATIYKCITGKTPVDSLERYQNDTLKKPSELGVNISPMLENVLMYGLAVYPDNRCQSMEELISITESALNNEQITLKNAANSATADDIYKTRAADEQYKTMFADKTYDGQSYYMNNASPSPQNNVNYPPSLQPQSKNNKVLIAALIALTVVVVAAIGVITAVIIKQNQSDDKKTAETVAVSETTLENDELSEETTIPVTTIAPTTKDNSITVPNVTGKKQSDAKKSLESLGLKVDVTKESNETVGKDYVIRQSAEVGESLKKGDTVTLVVSKGSSVNYQPYDQKVVVTASSGSSYAKLKLYNWEDGEWAKKMECDATVGRNGGISSNNSESNTLTPKGSFPLGVVLTASYQNTSMSQYTVTSQTVVCDDTSLPGYYNQIFEKGSLPSSAHADYIGQKIIQGSNNALIFIQHNGSGFSSSGVSLYNSSVITLCGCYGSLQPTGGCIDISASNMTKLLELLDSSKNPYIITEVK